MALLSAFVFLCWLGAVVTTVSSDNNFNNAEIELQAKYDFIRNLGQIIGYPRMFTNQQSDDLFTEEEMQEIISHESLDEEINAADHLDPCAHDLVRVAFAIIAQEKWAISMIDTDGKLPPGVLFGNGHWTGAYRECLGIQVPQDPLDNQKGFDGRYCTFSWTLKNGTLPITTGVCVPDTCQETDLRSLTNLQHVQKSREILPEFHTHNNSSKYVTLKGITCQAKTRDYDVGAIVVLVILFMFLFLVITGTSLTVIESLFPSPPSLEQPESVNTAPTEIKFDDVLKGRNSRENSELIISGSGKELLIPKEHGSDILVRIGDFLKCFCVIKNGKKILDTSDKGGTELRCIHGIRFLSMAWVILGHTYAFAAITNVFGNLFDFLKLMDSILFQIILQGTYSVDSFFVMSGFLLTHLFLREMNAREGKISWLAFYLHRYWRLTPVYAVVMAFDTTITWYLISGPFLPEVYENGCKKNWWWNLLYINNFLPQDKLCMSWSWYLANDMQFYVISPLFLYALWKWPKIGLGVVGALFCSSWISNFAISYHHDLFAGYTFVPDETTIGSYQGQMLLYFNKLYTKPYTRIGPYLIGVLLGYVFFKVNGRKNFLSKRHQAIGWIASTVLGIYIIFGLFHSTPNRVETAFYNAFNRCCFSASLAWVIFACLTGHGGVVNTMLSHSIFIPLGRLTYCAYLVHPIFITVYYLSIPSILIITHLQMAVLFLGFLLASYGIAFATTLMLESPTMAIERLFRSGGTAKR